MASEIACYGCSRLKSSGKDERFGGEVALQSAAACNRFRPETMTRIFNEFERHLMVEAGPILMTA